MGGMAVGPMASGGDVPEPWWAWTALAVPLMAVGAWCLHRRAWCWAGRAAFDPARLDGLDGPAFEDWVETALRRAGFRCRSLPRSRDYGIDLVAERRQLRIGVQAKRRARPIGNDAVQQAIAGAAYHGCAAAAVVTQSRFTAAARAQAAAAPLPVVLVERDGLAQLGSHLRRARG